jgi:hypothetical protein
MHSAHGVARRIRAARRGGALGYENVRRASATDMNVRIAAPRTRRHGPPIDALALEHTEMS